MAKGGKSKGKSSKTVDWVFCEACDGWFTFDKVNLSVDIKKVSDEDFIFICKKCCPQKEEVRFSLLKFLGRQNNFAMLFIRQEFNSLKPELKKQIGVIMDKHPTFSTALIARRCFASKSDSNEYHFGRPGIPVTLRELEEKMERDVTSLAHFKHIATVMAERMVSSVKGEFTSEAKIIKTEVEKLLKNLEKDSSSGSAPVNSSATKGKRGSKKAAAAATEEKPAKVSKTEAKPTRESRRGQKKKVDNAAEEKGTEDEADKKPIEAPATVKEEEKPAAKPATKARKKKGGGATPAVAGTTTTTVPAATKKESKAKKEEPAPVTDATPSSPVPNKEESKPEANAKPKRGNRKSTARGKKQQQNENVPNEKEKSEATATTKKEGEKEEVKATPAGAPNQSQSTTTGSGGGGGRKRKSGSALAPVNSNRGAKVQKTVAAKIITGSPGSPAKIAIAGNNLVSLSSLSQPLPPHVVLPTSPIAAPLVQNLKTSVSAPPSQVIQLRPAGTVGSSTTSPATTTMQIRPLRAAGNAAVGPRPQFFKIVGGKPVQISGSNVQRLPVTAGSLPGGQGGNRLVVMRGPVPSQGPAAVVPGGAASVATSAAAAGPGNKIILLSNKGQAAGVNPKGAAAAPSIVRIVSPNNLTTSGGKVALNPNSPTKVTTLRQAVGASGPILFRTVAPRSAAVANTTTAPPIQLPMAPLPKSALTSTPANNKKTTVAIPGQSNDTAKAIQVLLPKSPLPPTSAVNNSAAAGPGSPSKPIGGFTTTTTTTKNGAFVWTNSTRANFKLSSRINFTSLDRFKNMVNKDVHFILASIKTEDNSNEFSFRLHLKREPAPSSQGEQTAAAAKGGNKKSQDQSAAQQSYIEYLELEGKAKVPTAQEWSLKVKTEPPVFLVSKGNFLSDYPGARIPKEIADKPFVDYELHIDKCSPMQVAANATAAAPASNPTTTATTAPTPTPTRRGRKVVAK